MILMRRFWHYADAKGQNQQHGTVLVDWRVRQDADRPHQDGGDEQAHGNVAVRFGCQIGTHVAPEDHIERKEISAQKAKTQRGGLRATRLKEVGRACGWAGIIGSRINSQPSAMSTLLNMMGRPTLAR